MAEPYLKRPVGRPTHELREWYYEFNYKARRWSKARRIILVVCVGQQMVAIAAQKPGVVTLSSGLIPQHNRSRPIDPRIEGVLRLVAGKYSQTDPKTGIYMATVARSMPQFGLLFMLTMIPMNLLSGGRTPGKACRN